MLNYGMNKNKHLIIAGLISAIVLVTSIFAMLPLRTISTTPSGKDWMKKIGDKTLITSLSLPGSHDSGALHSIGDLSGKCQDLSISEQLSAGARFFDIRLQQRNNKLKVVHGFVDQDLDFSKTLHDFSLFLKDNPSEGLIVSIKKESKDVNSISSFDESLKNALKTYSSIWDTTGIIPQNLAKLRGKIFLISRYQNNTIGLDAFDEWLDPDSSATTNTFNIEKSNLHVQDYYKVKDIKNKQSEILNCFEYSNKNLDKLTLNFSSCYFLNLFPPTYAGISARIINNWLKHEVKGRKNLGIIVSDFVTSELCKNIYERNF